MTRAVYIGGFGNGRASAEGVGEALATTWRYEDVTSMTFAHAMDNPQEVDRATKGVDVLTHSAGILALEGTNPNEIISVGAPLPTNVSGLLVNTGVKTAKMLGHARTSPEASEAVKGYMLSTTRELARHPWSNLRHLRQIAKTNAIHLAASAQGAGIPTWLYYNEMDGYFRPTAEQRSFASWLGIALNLIPGQHDELPLYPLSTLDAIERVHDQ